MSWNWTAFAVMLGAASIALTLLHALIAAGAIRAVQDCLVERLDALESSLASGPDAARFDGLAGHERRIEALEADPCRGVKALDVATLKSGLAELTSRVQSVEATTDAYATREQAESLARSVEAFADKLDEHLAGEREHADALVAAHRRRWPAPDPGEAP